MDTSILVQLLEIVVGTVVTIFCVGAIPFAISVTSRLASIEQQLRGRTWHDTAIERLREHVQRIELRLAQRLKWYQPEPPFNGEFTDRD